MVKTNYTKKRFYDKWNYKVTLYLHGAAIFRIYSLDDLESKAISESFNSKRLTESKASSNTENILKMCQILKKYNKEDWQKRIERDYIDFYTNDKDLYKEISEVFDSVIRHRFEPNPTLSLNNDKKIVTAKLPHGKFRYKVYLKPHKMAGDKDSKSKYLNWLDTQIPRISISEAVKSWFMNTDWNWDRRYIWVEDQNTMLMLKLRNADVCGTVYEYQLADK